MIGGIFININNIPIDFVIIRASSIPEAVNSEKSKTKAGITGSDIIWESGIGKNCGEEIPISRFRPNYKSPMLFIGITEQFSDCIKEKNNREALIRDLSGKMVATKFPRITQEIFTERDVKEIEIYPVPGTTEAMQYIFDNCYGILDVISTGATVKANKIQVLEKFYQVSIRIIESPTRMSRQEKDILDELKECIFVAVQGKIMI